MSETLKCFFTYLDFGVIPLRQVQLRRDVLDLGWSPDLEPAVGVGKPDGVEGLTDVVTLIDLPELGDGQGEETVLLFQDHTSRLYRNSTHPLNFASGFFGTLFGV